MKYKVNIGKRNKTFATLEAANAFCRDHFARTGVVLSIVQHITAKAYRKGIWENQPCRKP